MKTLGQIAYEAYLQYVNENCQCMLIGKHHLFPDWAALDENLRKAFQSAAFAVIKNHNQETTHNKKTIGQINYETFMIKSGNFPDIYWEGLTDDVKASWEAAAKEVQK